MANDQPLTPLPLPPPGLGRVSALVALCRCLSAALRDEPPPVPADWAAVAATAENYRLTPALWEAVRGVGGLEEDVAERLRTEYAANVVATSRASTQLRECIGAFNRLGIEPVVIKGAVGLLEGRTPAPARVMADLDLLVRNGEIDRACVALRQLGYSVQPSPGVAAMFTCAATRPGLAAPVDLHRALGVGASARALPVSVILRRTSGRQVDGLAYRVMEAADQLAHAVVHSEFNDKAHRTGSIALRQLHNFAVLYQQIGHSDAWPTAVSRLDCREMRKLVMGHAALERYLFGLALPVPEPTLAARAHLARWHSNRRRWHSVTRVRLSDRRGFDTSWSCFGAAPSRSDKRHSSRGTNEVATFTQAAAPIHLTESL